MNVTLRQLEYVVAAARAGTIAGAAQALHISTSSVLMAIDKFEREFAVQLFVRQRAKGLVTTPAGAKAIARTIRMLDEAEAFAEEVSGKHATLAGELRIGCFTSVSASIAPQAIKTLRARHPDLTARVTEGDIVSIQQFLRDGEVDVLLTYDAGLWEEFDAEILVAAPPHAVLARTDPLAARAAVSLHDLVDYPLLLLNLPQSRNYVLSLFERGGLRPRTIQRFQSFEMVRSAAAAGLGVGILNIRPLTDQTYSGLGVSCRPLVEASPSPNIVLASRRGATISRRARAFTDACRAFCRSEPARRLFVRAGD